MHSIAEACLLHESRQIIKKSNLGKKTLFIYSFIAHLLLIIPGAVLQVMSLSTSGAGALQPQWLQSNPGTFSELSFI